jgi:uncharacterized protein (DUF362 family)
MISEERIQKLPNWIVKILGFLRKIKVPGVAVYVVISLLATLWFLARILPKPSRAAYPCMQVAAPVMSGFVLWLIALSGATFAFRKAKHKFLEAKYVMAGMFVLLGFVSMNLLTTDSNAKNASTDLKIWYKPNEPLGEGKGLYPGRVAWGHNPKVASWDEKTGFWWEDRFNNEKETDKLLAKTLSTLTGKQNEQESWDALFHFFNKTKRNADAGYKQSEKVTIKVNLNNTYSHESNNEINANPQLILTLLKSLVNKAGVAEENITVTDPSRFITNNVYDKCHSAFPKVHYIDHNGGDGREKASFVENAIPYSVDNGKVATGLASCLVNADYIINLALMKGHVSQGVTLCAKNFFGCTSIEDDWHKNAHSSGFSQNREGLHTYSVYTDYMGHKDLGAKTMLFLIDGIYGNKFVNQVPAYKWKLAPFNNHWPNSLFASQDGVAIDAVVLDFVLTEWPDAPDMMYSDYSVNESAQAGNPPSGTIYDPERDGTRLGSLGTSEHWNNPAEKKYSRNLGKNEGIELVSLEIK